jgi:hypothetical protein
MVFPKSVVYHDANKPDWMTIVKENDALDFTFEIIIEAMNKIRFNTDNVEAIVVDLPKAFTDTGLTVGDVNALISFIRFSTDKIYVTISGTGTDVYEIILPQGVSIAEIRKADGTLVPFAINMATNSVIFTVTFSSDVDLIMVLQNINKMVSSALSSILQVSLIIYVFSMVYNTVVKIPKEIGLGG